MATTVHGPTASHASDCCPSGQAARFLKRQHGSVANACLGTSPRGTLGFYTNCVNGSSRANIPPTLKACFQLVRSSVLGTYTPAGLISRPGVRGDGEFLVAPSPYPTEDI